MVFVVTDDLGELEDCLAVQLVVANTRYSSRLAGSLLSVSLGLRLFIHVS